MFQDIVAVIGSVPQAHGAVGASQQFNVFGASRIDLLGRRRFWLEFGGKYTEDKFKQAMCDEAV